jgi:hypothetical protein
MSTRGDKSSLNLMYPIQQWERKFDRNRVKRGHYGRKTVYTGVH